MFGVINKLINKSLYKFSFQPEAINRYFIVNYVLTDGFKGAQEQILEKRRKYIQQYEDNGHLIFGALKNQTEGLVMIFHTKTERIPHDFIQEDPIYKEKYVITYNLQEIELRTKGQITDLQVLYQYR